MASPSTSSLIAAEYLSSESDMSDQETESSQAPNAETDANPRSESLQQSTKTTETARRKKFALEEERIEPAMARFLSGVEAFFTKPINLQRQKDCIKKNTFLKLRQRMLGYLRFVVDVKNLEQIPEVFLRTTLLDEFFTFVQAERKCVSGTIANYAQALQYPAKFLHRENAPKYTDVEVIKQLRSVVNTFQAKASKERKISKAELEIQNKWLDWEEIVRCVGLQRERFEMARTAVARAREYGDLLLLSCYVTIPPGRALEIRTLKFCTQETPVEDMANENIVILHDDGSTTLRFQDFKTRSAIGTDMTTLPESHELSLCFREYFSKHRKYLLREDVQDEKFVFLNSKAERFSGPLFTSHLKGLFYRLTGVKISINALRSSFITYAYSRSDCTDSLKESIAASLRHSRRQSEITYDRRTSDQRKEQAINLATQASCDTSSEVIDQPQGSQQNAPKIGSFVALVEKESTLSSPKILLGRVHSILPNGRVSLLWYDISEGKTYYSFQLEETPWVENVDALVRVEVREVKNCPGNYKLITPARKIHREICGGRK